MAKTLNKPYKKTFVIDGETPDEKMVKFKTAKLIEVRLQEWLGPMPNVQTVKLYHDKDDFCYILVQLYENKIDFMLEALIHHNAAPVPVMIKSIWDE